MALLCCACGASSIDSVVDRKLRMCEQVRDEALRVECIRHADDGYRNRG